MTPKDLEQLRQQLPPFGTGARPAAALPAYRHFYNLDFSCGDAPAEHLAGSVRSGSFNLAVQLWRCPGATTNLLLVHGYFDHTGIFGKLVEWGLSQRCNVLTLDLPGHGLSSGAPAVIDDFRDYSAAINAVLETVALPALPLWVMAQSTGCAALMDYAQRYSWPFAAAVMLAPLVRPVGWPGVNIAQRLLGPFTDSVARKFSVNSSDHEFLQFVQREPLQCHRVSLRWVAALRRWLRTLPVRDLGVGPVLVIQGDADHTVDWRYNLPIVRTLFPASRVEMVAGAGHQLANESVPIRTAYLDLVCDYARSAGLPLETA